MMTVHGVIEWGRAESGRRIARRRLGGILAVLAVVAGMLALSAPSMASAADGSELTNETFEGSSVPDPRWVGFGDACVTGAPAASEPPAGSSNIGACDKTTDSPALGTEPGYLQLTDNSGGSTSNVLYDRAFPSSAGLVIRFTQYQYATSGTGLGPADGIGFFLTDGSYTLDQPGPTGDGSGGGLGYATINGQDGISNGYLGVGLDVYGNYSSQPYVGEACEESNPRTQNSVALRGPGDGGDGYCLLSSEPYPNLRGTSLGDAGREVEIVISPTTADDPFPTVTVTIDGTPVSTVQMTVPAPSTFKMGFSASTGGGHEVHLVKLFSVSTVDPLGQISLVKSVDHSAGTGTTKTIFTEGDVVPYSFLVTNTGTEEPIDDIVVTDPKISDIVCPATVLQVQDSFVCTGTYGPLTAEEAAAGSFENTAVVNGVTTISSTPVTDTSTVVIPTYGMNVFTVAKDVTGTGADAVPADTEFTVDYSWTGGPAEPDAGEGAFTVRNDGVAVASDPIPVGATVTLSETTPPVIDGVTWGSAVFSQDTFTIGAGEPIGVTLTNPAVLDVGSFTLVKAVTGSGAADVPADTEFTVDYAWSGGPGGVGEGDGVIVVRNDGVPVSSGPIPVGATVTLSEAPAPVVGGVFWGERSFSSNGFVIAAGSSAEITLTNPTLAAGRFSVTKSVTGGGAGLVPSDTAFSVDYTWTGGPSGYEQGEGTLVVRNDGKAVSSGPLPAGAVATLDETTPPAVDKVTWGTPVFSSRSFTITDGADLRITLTNPTSQVVPPPDLATTGGAVSVGAFALACVALVLGGLMAARRRVTVE